MSVQAQSQSNKHFSHTLATTAKPEVIWDIWIDVPNWKSWDKGLQGATIIGDFKLGAKGTIVSNDGRTSKWKVVAFEAGQSYTFKTSLPLGGLYVKRTLEVNNNETYFTHEVWFKGLTAGIFAKLFGGEFRALLPEVMALIKSQAEK